MKCDQVFSILTRGPFPTGVTADDFQVDQHLHVCQECRELAEALRPATALFHESLTHEAQRATAGAELPSYLGSLPELATASRTELRGQSTSTRTGWFSYLPANQAAPEDPDSRWAPTAIVLAIAVFLMVGIQLTRRSADPPYQQPSPSISATVYQPDVEERELLAKLLPVACLPTHESAVALPDHQCCTRCHHSDSEKVHRGASLANQIATLSAMCYVCHHP